MVKNYPGTLFLVVGNSGSGKDSMISGATMKYPSKLKKIFVPQRYITRSPTETEKNISISAEEFKKMDENGKFALKWHIYGLDYGIPIEIENWLKNGNPVLVNVSRTIVKEAREKYLNLKVVFIFVPLEIIVKRLKNRGRERSESLKERIERAKSHQNYPDADFIIDNSGELNKSIDQFRDYIISVVRENKIDN